MRFDSKVVRAGQKPEKITGAIITPIYQTSTYALEKIGRDKGFDYSRANHPTKAILEKNLTELEQGKGAVVFSSGMAAITALLHSLNSRDHLIVSDDVYGGTHRILTQIFNRFEIQANFVDMTELRNVENALNDKTRMILAETPSNPLLKLCDIKALAEIAGKQCVHLVIDNTFMTPYFQKPLKLGADTVVHSLTKYLAGHNDLIAGAIISRDRKLIEEMQFILKSTGAIISPFDSWLTLRGIKTLSLRMKKHQENALKIADYLEEHPLVKEVIYPGLKNHPQHDLAKKQMTGFGGMISFELTGGTSKAKKFMERLRLWLLAESLGGVESLITHPATMTHSAIPRKERLKRGIGDGLIRLSVGIEDVNDLIDDLEQALKGAK